MGSVAELEQLSAQKVNDLHKHTVDKIELQKDGKIYHKSLAISHAGENNYVSSFSIEEESDGTKRLFHILPVMDEIAHNRKVFLIDEIEQSIHPSLIKTCPSAL